MLSAIDIGEAASKGDTVAIEIIRDSGWLIGSVLAGLVEFINPEVIYIGGGVSKISFTLLSSIRQAILRRANPLSTRDLHVEYSQLGDMAGVVGAIALTFPYIFKVT
jgi:predicted NBD/HSP70 family sugar kinase